MASTTAAMCKEQGNACMSGSDYVNAMKWYSQAIALSPKDGSLFSNRSFAFLRLGLTSRALADADESVHLKPDWSKSHFRRAEALAQAGLHTEAMQSYAEGATLDPLDDHLRKSCEEARARGVGAKRREVMQVVAAGAVGVLVILLILAAPKDDKASQNNKRARAGAASAMASVFVGAILGILGGVATIWLRRNQRKGKVLAPLKTNDQFAAEQMTGMLRSGCIPLNEPSTCLSILPLPPIPLHCMRLALFSPAQPLLPSPSAAAQPTSDSVCSLHASQPIDRPTSCPRKY